MSVPLSEVTAILREVLHDNDLDPAPPSRFDDLAGWDSMDMVTVVVEVECRFDLQFEVHEIDALTTVGDLVRMMSLSGILCEGSY